MSTLLAAPRSDLTSAGHEFPRRLCDPDKARPRLATVTMCYPSAARPEEGVFVRRRLERMLDDVEARVVCPRPWFPGLRPRRPLEPPALRGNGLCPIDIPMFYLPGVMKRFDPFWFERALRPALSELRRGFDFQAIDAHFEWPDGVGAWRAARRWGMPIVVTLRGKLQRAASCRYKRRQIVDMLRDADALVAVSADLANLARRIASRDLAIDVIPNGVDGSVFHPVDSAAAREALGWTASQRWLVSVGHLDERKGFDRLVAALPALRRRHGDVRLALVGGAVGQARYEHRLKRLIDDLGLGSFVLFAGRLDAPAINLMLNAADLFALATSAEGCCNAIAEALAAGTPVVATDVGGNAELVIGEHLGLLAAGVDLASVTTAIDEALSRGWDRAAIAVHGRRRSWEKVAREAAAVFRRVLARG